MRLQDIRKKKRVRKEIIDTVVEHLVEISGTVANPSTKQTIYCIFHLNCFSGLDSMRWIVVILGNNYPNMFQDKGSEGMIFHVFFCFFLGGGTATFSNYCSSIYDLLSLIWS